MPATFFLNAISPEMHQPLLSYLNLPPAGCLADNREIFDTKNDEIYELTKIQRHLVLKERALAGGAFSTIDSLKNIHTTDADLLPTVLTRLEDINRYGNRVQPVWGGPQSKRAFFQLLNDAEKYIHISTYILGGEVGLDIVRLLAEKMEQGVEVRLFFCASGLVLSGSPSGTGFVNRLSGFRSFFINDLYSRKKIIAELKNSGVKYIDSSPIGCHWRRLGMKQIGIGSEKQYYKWAQECGFPEKWMEEQLAIDEQSRIGFVNVDHRKMTIVDGKKAFIGSQNLSDSYFYDNELSEKSSVNRKNWQWHDSSCILEGGSVQRLSDLFAARWHLSGGDPFDHRSSFYKPEPIRHGNACVTIVDTIPGVVSVPLKKNLGGFLMTLLGARYPLQIEGINPIRERLKMFPEIATEKMVVEHCYPSDTELLECWGESAKNLKSFQMIVPKHYDVLFLGMECDANYPKLISSGVQLSGYSPAILHAKIAVIDEFYAALGSYNINVRSSRADMECGFFIQCSEFGEQLQRRLEEDLKKSEKIVPDVFAGFRSKFSIPVIDAFFRYFLF